MPDHAHRIVRPCRPSSAVASLRKEEPGGRRATWPPANDAPPWRPRITPRRGRRLGRHSGQPGGGGDRDIVAPRARRALIDDLHFNPVRRGLDERASDWRWSSAAWFEGRTPAEIGLTPDPIPPEWAA